MINLNTITGFNWDEGNRRKNEKHGVSMAEAEQVFFNAPLLILEAMKMLNRIEMPFTARIKQINVAVGDRIPKETLMIILEEV